MTQREAYRMMLAGYPDILNVEQMCEVLKISTKTGYKLLNDGAINAVKAGRAYRIPKINVLRFLLAENYRKE